MIYYGLKDLPVSQKRKYMGRVYDFIPYDKSQTKVNMFFTQMFAGEESYREQLVSYYQFLPLLRDQVNFSEADYILVNVKIKLIEKFKIKLIEFYQFF